MKIDYPFVVSFGTIAKLRVGKVRTQDLTARFGCLPLESTLGHH